MGTSLRGSRILGFCGAVLAGVLAAVLSAPSVAAASPPYVSPVIATPKPTRPLDSAAMTGRLALPIPSGLHYTTNVATCVAHGGDAESCATLFRANAVALYWSDVGCTLCQLTGFRVRHPAVAFARVGSPPGPVIDQTKAP
ncbi:MAG: hypothetical protein JWO66_2751, partial [Candidatus Eremiobacteraeota bacterium]|nr:hypothetical protein [Candidatus Eremiobacteraeota bacterium]